jgi:hypothetical protein
VCSAYNLIGLWVRREGDNRERKEERDEENWQERKRIPEIAMVIVGGRSGPSCGGRPTDVLRRSDQRRRDCQQRQRKRQAERGGKPGAHGDHRRTLVCGGWLHGR